MRRETEQSKAMEIGDGQDFPRTEALTGAKRGLRRKSEPSAMERVYCRGGGGGGENHGKDGRASTHKHREEKEQVRQVWNRDAARKEGGRGCTSEAVFGDFKADNDPKPCFGPQGEPPEGLTMTKFLSRTTGGDVLSPNPCSQKLADRVSKPQTPRESTFQQQRIAPPPPRHPIPGSLHPSKKTGS